MSSVENIISRNHKIGHSYIREDLCVYGMINFASLISHNVQHCIKELIPFLSRYFPPCVTFMN